MNIDKNPLPFHELEGDIWTNFKPKWQSNNPNCKGYHYSNNLFPDTYFFQHMVSPSITFSSEIIAIELRKVSDNSVVAYSFNHYMYGDDLGNKYLIIKVNLASDLIGDKYYISTTTAYNKYYSEIFCVTNIKYDEVGLVWAATSKVGNMIYKNDFKHKVNIKAKIVPMPTEIEEETEEDGFGNETPTFQKLTQSYFFSAVLPNYLAQAFSAIPLHNQFKVIDYFMDEFGTDSFDENITRVDVKVTPEVDGCFSFVEVTYLKEVILKTSCEEELSEMMAFNTPPVANIMWNNTETTENRMCDVEDSCSQTIKFSVFDVDGNLDTQEWQRSIDNGATWVSAGMASGDTKVFTETDAATYSYRLKATDTLGEIGYSNILRYELYDLGENSVLVDLGLTDDECSGFLIGGQTRAFNLSGQSNQSVKVRFKVTSSQSYGSAFTVFERNTMTQLISRGTGLPAGFTEDFNLFLNSDGLGEFLIQICMVPCMSGGPLSTIHINAELIIFDNDKVTLTNQKIYIQGYSQCS